MEVCNTESPSVCVLIANYTSKDVVLRRKTVLGNIQPVEKIMKTDQSEVTNHTEVNNINTQIHPSTRQGETVEKWDPPVALAHLEEA